MVQIWSIANPTANAELIDECLPLLAAQFYTISTDEKFLRFTQVENMRALMSILNDKPVEEEDKVKTIASWINTASSAEDRASRIKLFDDLLELINIEKLPYDFMMNLALGECDFQLDSPCRKKLFVMWEQQLPDSFVSFDLHSTNYEIQRYNNINIFYNIRAFSRIRLDQLFYL